MNLQQALSYIHSTTWLGSRPGLERTRELLRRMGEPQKRLRFLHIAGTNGKGSTAAMLASILRQAGYRTGLYTSPYITHFSERMQVDGIPISDEALCQITEFVRPLAEAMEQGPTEFELITCIALEFFARSGCDLVVLEAGMGGALDSTNVIDTPECAILCRIGLDHTEYLGSTLAEIAATKAGIFKPGGLCVTYPAEPEVEAVYARAAAERQLDWRRADFSRLAPRSHDLTGQRFDFGPLQNLFLPLLGENQLCNAAVALTAVLALRERGWQISDRQLAEGLAQVRWPGRFELLRPSGPLFLVDGGHNPQCIQALAENLRSYLPGRRLTLLAGVMADKDAAAMFAQLQPLAAQAVTVTPDNPRAMPAPQLAQLLTACGIPAQAASSVRAGVRAACALAGPEGAVVALGSLYMVGEIRQCVLEGDWK